MCCVVLRSCFNKQKIIYDKKRLGNIPINCPMLWMSKTKSGDLFVLGIFFFFCLSSDPLIKMFIFLMEESSCKRRTEMDKEFSFKDNSAEGFPQKCGLWLLPTIALKQHRNFFRFVLGKREWPRVWAISWFFYLLFVHIYYKSRDEKNRRYLGGENITAISSGIGFFVVLFSEIIDFKVFSWETNR